MHILFIFVVDAVIDGTVSFSRIQDDSSKQLQILGIDKRDHRVRNRVPNRLDQRCNLRC